MGPIVNLRISFDIPQGGFYPGTAVTGHVHVIVEEKDGAKIRGVKIRWKGESKTHFRSGGSRYTKSETHIENEMYVMGSSDRSKPCILLQEGSHAIPFSVFLPPNIPGSYEDGDGKISYFIYAKINFPYNLFDPSSTLPFKVLKQNVLSANALNPVLAELDNSIGLFCFSKGNVSMNVRLQRSGYLPGEEMHFSLHVENNSSVEMITSSVALVQYTYFSGTTVNTKKKNKRRHREHKVSRTWGSIHIPAIKPHGTYSCEDNVISLSPSLIPSNLFECCTIMRTSYLFEVRLKFPFPYQNKTRTIPIAIGSSYGPGRASPSLNTGPNMFIQANPAGAYVPSVPGYPVPPPSSNPSNFINVDPLQYSNPSAPVTPTAPRGEYSPPPPYNPMPEEVKY